PVPARRGAGAEFRGAQRHGLRQYHRPHRRHRAGGEDGGRRGAAVGDALHPRDGRQPRLLVPVPGTAALLPALGPVGQAYPMRILLLSAYDADSHRRWREGLVRELPQHAWTVLALPPRHFSWRIRGNALSWAFGERDT